MNTISSRYYTVDHNYRGEKIAPYTVDVSKMIEDDIKSGIPNKNDTLTLSDNYVIYQTQKKEELSDNSKPVADNAEDFSYYEYYKNIDHFDTGHFLLRKTGLSGDTDECVARTALYFGVFAKEYDESYAQGKITKEEYDDLNERLKNDAEKCISGIEESNAIRKYWGEFYNAPAAKQGEISRHWKRMTSEENRSEFRAEIEKIIQQFCKIDRTAFWDMLNSYRNSYSINFT